MTTDPMPASPGQPPVAQAPAAPMPNPFAGIPVSDLVRDAVAALLLLFALGLPWQTAWTSASRGDFTSPGFHYIAVDLITLLSLASLAVTYAGRAQLFGPQVSASTVALIRAAANVPYILLAAVFLVLDMPRQSNGYSYGIGVGFGIAFGLAGAIVAAAPRKSEVASLAPWQARLVRFGLTGLAGWWTLLTLVGMAMVVSQVNDYDGWSNSDDRLLNIGFLLKVFVIAALLAALTVGLVRQTRSARVTAIVAGVIGVTIVLIDWALGWDLSQFGVESFHGSGIVVLATMSLGALAASASLSLSDKPQVPAIALRNSAFTLLLAMGAIATVNILFAILVIVSSYSGNTGQWIGYIATLVFIGFGTLFAAIGARAKSKGSRILAIVLTAGAIPIGIGSLVLLHFAAGFFYGYGATPLRQMDVILLLGMPMAVIILLAMAATRTGASTVAAPAQPMMAASPAYATAAPLATPAAPLAAPAAPPAAPVAPAPPAPVAPPVPPAPPAPVAHPRSAEAADPSTSTQALFEIASNIPELRAAVAANPSTYPDLLTWLGVLGDPAVDAALRARGL